MKTTTTIYEVMLREQDEDELIVDVRITVEDKNGNTIFNEYEEGFSFTEPIETERYSMARREFNRLLNKYSNKMHDADMQSPKETHQVTEYDELFIHASKILEIKHEEDSIAIATL